MTIVKPCLNVFFLGKTSAFNKDGAGKLAKKKARIGFSENDLNGVVIHSKLLKNPPRSFRLFGKRRVVLRVRDQVGNVGYVKVNASSLGRWGANKQAIKNKGIDGATEYIMHHKPQVSDESQPAVELLIAEEEPSIKKGGKEFFEEAKLTENEEAKLKLLQKAAKLKYTPALYKLGRHYQEAGDNKQAFFYFQKAANLGYTDSKFELALLFIEIGKEKKAERWLLSAAQDGHFIALLILADGSKKEVEAEATILKIINSNSSMEGLAEIEETINYLIKKKSLNADNMQKIKSEIEERLADLAEGGERFTLKESTEG